MEEERSADALKEFVDLGDAKLPRLRRNHAEKWEWLLVHALCGKHEWVQLRFGEFRASRVGRWKKVAALVDFAVHPVTEVVKAPAAKSKSSNLAGS